MHKNIFWLCFLGVIAACTLGYTSFTAYQLWGYAAYSQEVEPQELLFNVVLRNGEFYTVAHYSYVYQGKQIKSHSELAGSDLNRWAAEKKIKNLQTGSLQKRLPQAWINPRKPHDSTLQKNFPIKECISTTLLWGIFGYFLWLGFYVARKDGRNHA